MWSGLGTVGLIGNLNQGLALACQRAENNFCAGRVASNECKKRRQMMVASNCINDFG